MDLADSEAMEGSSMSGKIRCSRGKTKELLELFQRVRMGVESGRRVLA